MGNADDRLYTVQPSPAYAAGTTVDLVISNGPLGSGTYRLTLKPTLTDAVGNLLDGDGNGSGGDAHVREFAVALPAGYLFEGQDNGTRAQATALTLSEATSGLWLAFGLGSLDPDNDNDWWSFSAQAGDKVAIALDSAQVDGYFHCYNAEGNELFGENDSGPNSSDYYSYFTVSTAGTYYVRTRSQGSVGTYALRLELARGIGLESDGDYDNGSIGGADGLTLAQSGNHQLGTVAGTVMDRQGGTWDYDYYRLGVLNAGQVVDLKLRLPRGQHAGSLAGTAQQPGPGDCRH